MLKGLFATVIIRVRRVLHVLNMDFGVDWHLVFAASYVVMMIIPGHYLNHKAKKQ